MMTSVSRNAVRKSHTSLPLQPLLSRYARLLYRLRGFAAAIDTLTPQGKAGHEYQRAQQNKERPGWWKRRIIRRWPTHRNTGDQSDGDHLYFDESPCQPTAEARFLRIT